MRIKSAYVEITGWCNMNCPYCYNSKIVNSGSEISVTSFQKLVNDLADEGIGTLTLSGGEPCLHSDFESVIASIVNAGLKFTLISNGHCFNDEIYPLVKKLTPALQITIDGYNAETHDFTRGKGNFAIISEGILRYYRDTNTPAAHIRLNIGKHNVNYLRNTLEYIEERFFDTAKKPIIKGISVSLLHSTSEDIGAYDGYFSGGEYIEYPELCNTFEKWNESHELKIQYDFDKPDFGCIYNNQQSDNIDCGIRIAPDGEVFPCQMFTDIQFSQGNINRDSIRNIIKSKRFNDFSLSVQNRKNVIESCCKCAYSQFCAGGCPGTAFYENGTIFSISSRCDERKKKLKYGMLKLLKQSDR